MRSAFRLRTLTRCQNGNTMMEFAFAAPVFIVLVLGSMDVGHMIYTQSILNGAVENAARNSTLEESTPADEDQYVRDSVSQIAPGSTFTFTRRAYRDFVDIEKPEPWNDVNNNGECDADETYTDQNKNGVWDEDVGTQNNGGANEVVLYSARITYNSIFRIPLLPQSLQDRTLESTTVRRNQPYAVQQNYGSTAGVCAGV